MVSRSIAVVLSSATSSSASSSALQLADRLLAAGHRVMIFAHGTAVDLALDDGPIADAARALVHRGVHGATLDWVVESSAAGGRQMIDGVVVGDDADLWRFVRAADVVLAPGGGQPWRVVS